MPTPCRAICTQRLIRGVGLHVVHASTESDLDTAGRSIIDASERKNASSILEARYPFLKRLSELPPALRNG
jgi:hypothetical protein